MAGKRVAIYRRVSTLDQAREGYSLAAQERTLQAYCESRGYTIVAYYADEGISGRTTEKRPSFLKMIEDARNNQFGSIIVISISRLSRSVCDLYTTWHTLDRYGVSVESINESLDTSSAMGKAMLGIVGVFAQLESDLTSERVKIAAAERAMQGKRTCNYVLGYDAHGTDTFAVNSGEAEVVRYAYEKYVEFGSLSAVAECCTLKGYRGKFGKILRAESVKKILTLPLYVGYNRFHGTLYRGAHDPIVDIKTYNKAQRMLHRPEIKAG